MSVSLRTPGSSPTPVPVGPILAPTDEAWRAMTPVARERFLSTVNAAISETRPHEQIKRRAVDMLSLQFKAVGGVIYVADAMAVVYPGVEVFAPDVLVVLGVEQPVDDERRAWVVADEGRGLDLVLEVHHHGDRNQVRVDNVERYASLGIPEYFIYDCGAQQIYGYRLVSPEARHYQRIESRAAHYHSMVLGLELVVQRGSLRFIKNNGELIGPSEKIVRLSKRVDQFEAQARQAQAKLDEALAAIGENVLAILAAREIRTDDIRSRVLACEDLEILQRWLARALVVTSAQDVFSP